MRRTALILTGVLLGLMAGVAALVAITGAAKAADGILCLFDDTCEIVTVANCHLFPDGQAAGGGNICVLYENELRACSALEGNEELSCLILYRPRANGPPEIFAILNPPDPETLPPPKR